MVADHVGLEIVVVADQGDDEVVAGRGRWTAEDAAGDAARIIVGIVGADAALRVAADAGEIIGRQPGEGADDVVVRRWRRGRGEGAGLLGVGGRGGEGLRQQIA